MVLNYFDVAILCILVMFSVRGLLRGFVGEAAGLVAVIGGVWYAHRTYMQVAAYLTFISEPTWRNIAAYVLVFLAVLLVVGLVARLLRKILSYSFVSWADKLAGFLLGLLKGLLICAVLLLLLERFLGDAAFLRESRVLPYLKAVMEQIRAYLPDDFLRKFNF